MMRTISLEKMNMIRRILFVVILLVAFAMVFAVTAKPSHAETYTLEGDCVYFEDYSPGVDKPTAIKPTQFELYKVGSFTDVPPNYVEWDETYRGLGVPFPSWTKEQIDQQPVAWTKDWLLCAGTLDEKIQTMSPKPTPSMIEVDANGKFSKDELENGIYLLRGESQIIENYPEEGESRYWWPQPMLVSVLNGNVEIHVKPMSGIVHHMKVQKEWQWPSELSESVKKLVQPEKIKVEIYYGETLYQTVVMPDEQGNWYYKWDAPKDKDDPEKWRFKEVIEDDPATEINETEEFYKNFTVSYGKVQIDGKDEVVTITNKYDRDTLEIVKRLNGFVDNGGESIALTFELSGYKGDSRIYHKFVGMEFDANSGDIQTLPVKDIPLELTRLVVKEVSSSNYTPVSAEQDATLPAKNADGTKGPYTVSFDNNLTNQIYNSGIVNKFKLTQNGYEFERQGNGE